MIISGFPGVGKSYFYNECSKLKLTIKALDSDSSLFSWIVNEDKRNRHPEFPQNYIEHIKNNIKNVNVILVSSHDVVREALKINNLEYTIVYPDISCKYEYIERFKQRGNDEGFIKMIENNWEKFITEIESDNFPDKIKLSQGQYLSRVLIGRI